MAHSYAQETDLTCPQCGQTFSADVWLIVDLSERPDLLERVREGTLHAIPCCPHCGRQGEVDAPLLLYRPTETPPLLFSPAQGATAEQDREQAAGLLGLLRERLGDAWQDEWVDEMPAVPRPLLPALLSDDPEAALAQMAGQAQQEIERLRQEDPETFRQLEEAVRKFVEHHVGAQGLAPLHDIIRILAEAGDSGRRLWEFITADTWDQSRRILEQHPELLTDEADALLGQLMDACTLC